MFRKAAARVLSSSALDSSSKSISASVSYCSVVGLVCNHSAQNIRIRTMVGVGESLRNAPRILPSTGCLRDLDAHLAYTTICVGQSMDKSVFYSSNPPTPV